MQQETLPTAVDIENLSLTFETADGPVYALSDINLQIDEGDIYTNARH